MGVYTKLSHEDIKKILSLYSSGVLIGFEGIEQGIQNTIYRVKTSSKTLILTIYEQEANPSPLLATNRFVSSLALKGIPTSPLLQTTKGDLVVEAQGKLASLSPFLLGKDKTSKSITPKNCETAGIMLAQMHKFAPNDPKENPINPEHIYTLLQQSKKADVSLDIFEEALTIKNKWQDFDTPRAMIHADFFPDNVLWLDDQISGVLDFNFCYNDYIFYDLAIALTAWCFDENNVFQKERFDAFLKGYTTLFPAADVLKYLDQFLIVACFRFSMTRLHDLHLGNAMAQGKPHDPKIYIDRYLFFCEHGKTLTHE